jgi:hypothetical protein
LSDQLKRVDVCRTDSKARSELDRQGRPGEDEARLQQLEDIVNGRRRAAGMLKLKRQGEAVRAHARHGNRR